MANVDDAALVKELLGSPDDVSDAVVTLALESAQEIIQNYCNIVEIPNGLHSTLIRMAVDICRNEEYGSSDGGNGVVKSLTEGDTSISYGDTAVTTAYAQGLLKDYRKSLNAYRRLRW